MVRYKPWWADVISVSTCAIIMLSRRICRLARVDELDVTRNWMKKAVDSLPSSLRGNGWLLVELMDQNRFMLDPNGQFIPQDSTKPIPGSYFHLLLLYFLHSLYSKDRLFGFNMLREKWHDFYCDASLLFDFSCVFVRDGIVGCNPRLLKIVYHSTAEEADQLKPM